MPTKNLVSDLEADGETTIKRFERALDLQKLYMEYSTDVLRQVGSIGCPVKQNVADALFESAIRDEAKSIQKTLIDMFEKKADLC